RTRRAADRRRRRLCRGRSRRPDRARQHRRAGGRVRRRRARRRDQGHRGRRGRREGRLEARQARPQARSLEGAAGRARALTRVPGKFLELLHYLLVDRPLERHDQVDDVGQLLPAPLHEFRIVAAGGVRDVDFAVLSGEAQRIPFLTLPAVLAAPGLADDLARNVVAELFLDFAELFDRADIGFLIELAWRRRPRVLAAIDAPLRQLPRVSVVDMLRPVDAAADEDAPLAVEYGHADAGTIGQGFEAGHALGSIVPAWRAWHTAVRRDSCC